MTRAYTVGTAAESVRTLPAFCRVTATLKPTRDSDITIEAWMPSSGWNGKFQAVGNGAFNGSIAYPSMMTALARGDATSSTDTGHTGNNASFATRRPRRSHAAALPVSPGGGLQRDGKHGRGGEFRVQGTVATQG